MSKLDNLADCEIDFEDLESVSGGNYWCNPCPPKCEPKCPPPPCHERNRCEPVRNHCWQPRWC